MEAITPRVVELNGRRMKNRNRAHRYIQWKLRLPAYYGRNLDALHDCLTELEGQTLIRIRSASVMKKRLGEYGQRLLTVFADSAAEIPGLQVETEE